jgi:hypothetical protein
MMLCVHRNDQLKLADELRVVRDEATKSLDYAKAIKATNELNKLCTKLILCEIDRANKSNTH